MIADLAMYDWPGVRAANDAYWSEVARRLEAQGIPAPASLARAPDIDAVWRHPDLLIGQTCGMPYVSGHCGTAILVGRPDYGLEGARDGTYRSAIVVRKEEAPGEGSDALLACAGRKVAVNGWASYSGHVALRAHLAELRGASKTPFFGAAVISGGHLFSARLVAEGAADVAALDWVAWELLRIHELTTAARLRVIDLTAAAPSLPFITAPGRAGQVGALVAALDGAARTLPAVVGVPRSVSATTDTDFAPTCAAARHAGGEKFAPESPNLPKIRDK